MSGKRPISRSEEVRRRKASQARKRRPPVTARAGTGSLPAARPAHRGVRQPARRTYNVAVGLPGRGVRVPALPRLRFDWRMASFALTVVLGMALYTLLNAPSFQIQEAEVLGVARISPAEVNAVLGLYGRPAVLVQPETLEANLRAAFPDMKTVNVQVGLPNRLTVTAVERTPAIVWQQNGAVAWIDLEGFAFPPRGQVDGLIQVIASGSPPPVAWDAAAALPGSAAPYLGQELVAALVSLAPSVPVGIPILYDPGYGLGWQDARGWLVYFGNRTGDLALKLRVYNGIAESLGAQGLTPVLISVEYPDAPYYRLEP